MAAAGPEGPRSVVAAGAVSAALQRMGPRDQFGLWFFPDAAGTGPVEAVPVGPSDPARLAAAHQLLAGTRPAGNTPLFRTVIDAAATLEPDDPAQVDAVVVLTDGEDTSSGVGADAVTAALAGSGFGSSSSRSARSAAPTRASPRSPRPPRGSASTPTWPISTPR